MDLVTRFYDTPLGPATMSQCRSTRLAGVLDHLWHFDGVIADRRERVLPNGTLELVLTLGDAHRVVEDGGLRALPRVNLGGMRSRPLVLDHPARCDTLGIILRPAGAYALLARDLSELTETMVDGRDLLGRDATELCERCGEVPSVRDRFEIILGWLTSRLADARAPDAAIAWVAAQLERTGGDVRVAALRAETALSKARLVEGFRRQIGVPPKRYARLVRFRRALDRLQGSEVRLSDIALEAGYYDQAHMDADFREFAGICPTEFLATRFAEGSGNTARER